MRMDSSLSAEGRRVADAWDRLLLAAIWCGIAGWIWFNLRSSLLAQLIALADRHGWRSQVIGPCMIWLAMATLLLVVRTSLWIRYRPLPSAHFDDAPRMTIVIPAYNEGAMVAKTIASCAAADYPADRIEIVAIDDGSTDDTWAHICAAARRCSREIRTIRFTANQGKRAALSAGFEQARGDVVVTVDSDCVIERDALLALAGPFRNARVGAVAGKVSVFNRKAGFLPRMLHVRFALSFDFMRSAQSTYGTVYCCPGALSAYRATVLHRVVPAWRDQTFLGAPCTIGEDRALTNDILNQGYDAVYQRNAVVQTIVPHTYRKLCRMFLRWDRSYIREEIRLARIVWRRPARACAISVLEQTLTNLRYPVGYIALAMAVALSFDDPWTLARTLLTVGIAGLFYTLYFLRSERSWEFVYGIAYSYFALFGLLWIFPYALFTVRNRAWLTR